MGAIDNYLISGDTASAYIGGNAQIHVKLPQHYSFSFRYDRCLTTARLFRKILSISVHKEG
jgi:hypothetical protein